MPTELKSPVLSCSAAELPYFSLSWVLTLMSHDLTSISVIARLFDFLLAHNPAMVSYLGVAVRGTYSSDSTMTPS